MLPKWVAESQLTHQPLKISAEVRSSNKDACPLHTMQYWRPQCLLESHADSCIGCTSKRRSVADYGRLHSPAYTIMPRAYTIMHRAYTIMPRVSVRRDDKNTFIRKYCALCVQSSTKHKCLVAALSCATILFSQRICRAVCAFEPENRAYIRYTDRIVIFSSRMVANTPVFQGMLLSQRLYNTEEVCE